MMYAVANVSRSIGFSLGTLVFKARRVLSIVGRAIARSQEARAQRMLKSYGYDIEELRNLQD